MLLESVVSKGKTKKNTTVTTTNLRPDDRDAKKRTC